MFLRYGSSENASKSIGGIRFPMATSEPKAEKPFDRKPSTKSPSFQEKRIGKASEMQLQEELKKAREERTRALEDLEELRSAKKMSALTHKEEMDTLEKKAEKAKESERKMLESLVSQTKQLEQAKILLEEAKLEIMSLQDSIKCLEKKEQSPLDLIRAQEEIRMLKKELKLATEAEENSREAMDDLAVALKEVSTENNHLKARLSMLQSELEKAKFEAKTLIKITEDKLQVSAEDFDRMKLETEDLDAMWKEKENGFLNCMNIAEEEITKLKSENNKWIESLRGSRDETSKLRDILKQAVNEATVVKDALEIARNENSQLKDLVSEKENYLQRIKQEYECLKVSEAAATDSVKELKGFLAATPIDSTRKISVSEVAESKQIMKFPSDRLWRGDAKIINGKNKLFSSLSNVSDSRIPSSLYTEDRETLSNMDFDHITRTQTNAVEYESGSPMIKKKKKPMLKRFGDMLRRESFHK